MQVLFIVITLEDYWKLTIHLGKSYVNIAKTMAIYEGHLEAKRNGSNDIEIDAKIIYRAIAFPFNSF